MIAKAFAANGAKVYITGDWAQAGCPRTSCGVGHRCPRIRCLVSRCSLPMTSAPDVHTGSRWMLQMKKASRPGPSTLKESMASSISLSTSSSTVLPQSYANAFVVVPELRVPFVTQTSSRRSSQQQILLNPRRFKPGRTSLHSTPSRRSSSYAPSNPFLLKERVPVPKARQVSSTSVAWGHR